MRSGRIIARSLLARLNAHRISALLLALGAVGCGARSELLGQNVRDRDCAPVQIGLFGNPGAYDSSEFQGWLTASSAVVERVQTTPNEPVTPETLEPFDVVILDWLTRDYSADEAAATADWIAAGHGLISMTGWNNDLSNDWRANSLIAPLGVAYTGPLIDGPVATFEPHPITDGLISVVFKGGYAISEIDGSESARAPIAYVPTEVEQVPVGYAIEKGAGRAFVWGDEWIEFLTTDTPFQPATWVQAVEWLAPDRCVLLPPG